MGILPVLTGGRSNMFQNPILSVLLYRFKGLNVECPTWSWYINVCEGPILGSWNSEMFEQPVGWASKHFAISLQFIPSLTLNNKAGWKHNEKLCRHKHSSMSLQFTASQRKEGEQILEWNQQYNHTDLSFVHKDKSAYVHYGGTVIYYMILFPMICM